MDFVPDVLGDGRSGIGVRMRAAKEAADGEGDEGESGGGCGDGCPGEEGAGGAFGDDEDAWGVGADQIGFDLLVGEALGNGVADCATEFGGFRGVVDEEGFAPAAGGEEELRVRVTGVWKGVSGAAEGWGQQDLVMAMGVDCGLGLQQQWRVREQAMRQAGDWKAWRGRNPEERRRPRIARKSAGRRAVTR